MGLFRSCVRIICLGPKDCLPVHADGDRGRLVQIEGDHVKGREHRTGGGGGSGGVVHMRVVSHGITDYGVPSG